MRIGSVSWSPKQVDEKAKILFVKNLPCASYSCRCRSIFGSATDDISEVEISKLFSTAGAVENVRVVTAGPDRRNKGDSSQAFDFQCLPSS